jgi:hypothetical protein
MVRQVVHCTIEGFHPRDLTVYDNGFLEDGG